MADPMAMLDMEKRTGVKNSEIDDFLKKATALESAISGISDGSLDPDKVSLKKYGILTAEEEAEEAARREKNRVMLAERVAKEKAEEKVKEREKWWDGADYMFGPRVGSDDYNEELADKNATAAAERARRTEEEQQKLVDRYSMDYSRWSDNTYVPDDEVSKEEAAAAEKVVEDKKMAQFEATNSEWCESQKEDMDKRTKLREKKERSANQSRLKGNNYFKARKFDKAEKMYMEALASQGYKSNILTNLIQVHVKMKNWEDALEFCERALHVDRKNVKALSRRAHVYVESCDSSSKGKLKVARVKALQDLERAMAIEPENADLLKQRDDLSQLFQDEEMELKVKAMVLEEERRVEVAREVAKRTNAKLAEAGSDAGADGKEEEKKDDPKTEAARLWMERGMEKLAKGEDFNEAPPVSAFEVVDQMMDKIEAGEISKSMMPDAPGGSSSSPPMPPGMGGLFGGGNLPDAPTTVAELLKMSLEETAENRVYLRSSNKLEALCGRLMDEKNETERGPLFQIIAAACMSQKRSKDVVYEKMGLAAAIACLYDAKQPLEARIGASKLINECIEEEGGASAACVKLVCPDVGIIASLSKLLFEISASSAPSVSALQPLELLRDLANHPTTKALIVTQFAEVTSFLNGEEHPVGAAVLALTAKNATAAVREAGVSALSNLALSPKMRTSFCVTVQSPSEDTAKKVLPSGVQALLAVARAHKTETPAARAIALATLMNATIDTERKAVEQDPDEANDANGVKREIAHFGGLPILVALISSNKEDVSPLPIKQRAAGLLSRCMGNPKCSKAVQADSENGKKIGQQLVNFVLKQDQAWSAKAPNVERAQADADTATQLVRVLAAFKPAPASVTGYVAALVTLLPQPQVDAADGGNVTARSVCMPPQVWEEGSAGHVAQKDTTLVANTLKALIAYLDSGSVESVLAAGGLECLICCLANNNMFKSPAVRKNAGAAMARIVQKNAKAMERCRELRGMEILVELGNTGKI